MDFSLFYRNLQCLGSSAAVQKHLLAYAVIMSDKTVVKVVKVLPHVMRSVNELNIPSGDTQGYEILYFGVNLILMLDYRLSFNIEVKGSDYSDQIEVLIISRKDVPAWKDRYGTHDDNNSVSTQRIKIHYRNNGRKINDVFKPSVTDSYAFILSNRTSSPSNNEKSKIKAVKAGASLLHS